MPVGRLLGCALFVAVLVSEHALAAPAESRVRVELVARDGVAVLAAPSATSRVIARLVQQTQVEVVGKRGPWAHVRLWAALSGWMRTSDLLDRKPWSTTSSYRAPTAKNVTHATGPFALGARAVLLGGASPRGGSVRVARWRQDSQGTVLYEIHGTWVPSARVDLAAVNPGLTEVGGVPIWRAVSGKGMWLTLGTVTETSPQAIVRAARSGGLTHLYVEAAISPLGFHGRDIVAPLLAAAHRAGLRVLAWVYPYLDDVASDIALTRRVASYRTSSGTRFDGIAADLERHMTADRLRPYSQLVRHYLGDRYLLVGVSYPPQSIPKYPFEVLAKSFNAIAPMDYWHQTPTARGLDYGNMRYGFAYAYRYASDSVAIIKRHSGHVPVTVIGQTFDDFGRLEMGPHAPSGAEVEGFLQGSRASGAVGASFFQWMTATDAEWKAIHQFRF